MTTAQEEPRPVKRYGNSKAKATHVIPEGEYTGTEASSEAEYAGRQKSYERVAAIDAALDDGSAATALLCVEFLIDWHVEEGNEDLDGWLAKSLSNVIRRCAKVAEADRQRRIELEKLIVATEQASADRVSPRRGSRRKSA